MGHVPTQNGSRTVCERVRERISQWLGCPPINVIMHESKVVSMAMHYEQVNCILNILNKSNRGEVLRLHIVYLKNQVSQVA